MSDCKIPHRQLTAWLAAALIPTTIQLIGGASWLTVLLVATVSLLFIWLRWDFGAAPKGKLAAVLQWLLMVTVLSTACRYAAKSWPSGEHPAVGIILLSLAVWSISKGTSAAARVGYLFTEAGKPIPIGYIGSVNNFEIKEFPKVGETIFTNIEVLQEVMGITLIMAHCYINKVEIASCKMKIFLEINEN